MLTTKTNVVLIITDNQGAWTLGCYGNDEIRTPNIDRLAAEGLRVSRAYCVNSVCSPCRATLLTGLIPSQHGIHSYLGGEVPDAQMGPDAYCTIREFPNLPRILSENGYTCGLSGKWHLGDSLQPQEGFSYWFTKPKGHTSRFYNDEAIWQGKVHEEPRYYTDAITDHAVDFLRQTDDGPFFLMVGYNAPYGLGESMLYEHRNRHTAHYADKELKCFPRESVHPWLYNNRDMINNPTSIRGYASAVSGVDDGVATVLDTLREIGHDRDTLVVYTTDQGFCGGHHGMWGMGDHSRPIHTYEESVRIPLIYRHLEGIPGGRVWDRMTGQYDIFPTILSYLGLRHQTPDCPTLPGNSYAPVLRGGGGEWEDLVFFEYENVRMIRTSDWRYTRRHPDGPDELYDMRNDPCERMNLVAHPDMAQQAEELRHRLEGFFDRYADPQYDLWEGGRSKAGRLI